MGRTTGNSYEAYLDANEISHVADVDFKWGTKSSVKSRALAETEPSIIGLGSKDNPSIATITVERDTTDTNGQVALDAAFNAGTTVSLKLYPEGRTAGNVEISGDAYVTDRGNLQGQKNNVKETVYTLEFSGAPTEGTYSA